MPDRRSSVIFLGNDAQLSATLARIETKLKALSATAEGENAKMAASSEAAAGRMGKAYDEGTTKAGGALHKLSQLGASFGLPMVGSLDAVGKKLDETHTKTGKLTESLAALGKVTLVGGLAGFAAAAYEGVKGAASLQRQMEMLHTQAGATQAEVGKMTGAVLNMAGSVGTGPQQLAEALYHIESAGIRGGDAIKVLKAAAEGAKVGNANLTDVTNALNAAVVSGISGVQSYQQAMGVLNSTVGAGDMKMQDLAEALGTGGLLSIAKNLGVGIKDVGASLAVFGDVGIRGADASTKLKQALLGMAAPTGAQAKYLKAIGMSTLQMANDLRSGGIIGALADLKHHLEASGATASQQALVLARIFDKRSLGGVETLLSGLDRLKAKYQEVGGGASKFGSSVAATHHTLAFQMDQLKATVQALADKFGMFLIPKLEATAHAISDVIEWFGRHKAVAEALAAVIGGVLSVAVGAFVVNKLAAMIDGLRLAATRLGLMGGAAAAATPEVAGLGAAADVEAGALGAATTATEGLTVATTTLGDAFVVALTKLTPLLAAYAAYQAFTSGGQLNAGVGENGPVAGAPQGLSREGQISYHYLSPTMKSFVQAGVRGGASANDAMKAVQGSGGADNWKIIAGYLKSQGLSNTAIAGILGNFAQETGGGSLTAINTADSGNGASGMGGMGIGQWTKGRYTAEKRYAASIGESPTSLYAQLGYLMQELHGSYGSALSGVQYAGSAGSAASTFNRLFEGGTDPGGVRERAAAQALKLLGGGGSSASDAVRQQLAALNSVLGGSGNAAVQNLINGSASGHRSRAAATATIPAAVVTMLSTAQALVGASYTWGGGHGSSFDPVETLKKIGVDCSGFVSAVLHSGGVRMPGPLTTQGLPGVLTPGQGLVTVWDRHTGAMDQQHTLIDIMGKWFESGGRASPGGVSQISAKQGAQELAGGGFQAYHPTLGAPYATAAQLRAAGLSAGYNVANAGFSLSQLEQAFTAALIKAADTLAQKLGNAIQTGTLKVLENVLGVSTGGSLVTGYTGRGRRRHPIHQAVSAVLSGEVEGIPGLSSGSEAATTAFLHGIDVKLGATVNRLWGGSQQGQQFNSTIAQLLADGQKAEAEKLLALHKSALATLAQELYAQQTLKDGELLNLQATQLKDQTQLQANTDAAQLEVVKATQQKTTDALNAQVTSIRDMTQIVTDRFSAMAQRVEDSIQQMADSANQVVSGINDRTQIQVDVLGERGLYGLNLVAQKLQVQSDETKAYWDQQIALAQQSLDTTTATENAAVQAAQLNLDQVTAAQDQLVALQQQTDDTAHIKAAQMIAAAQAHADAVTLHYDTAVVGPAQMAVDLNATAPKAQQDVFNAVLRRAQGQAGVAEGQAGANLEAQTNAANKLVSAADYQYAQAQATAAIQEASAQQTLASIQGEASYTIAQAKQGLQGVQDSANIAEAQSGSAVSVARARAQTEFAGTGTVINVYGVPLDNATAISSELSWAARTMLP